MSGINESKINNVLCHFFTILSKKQLYYLLNHEWMVITMKISDLINPNKNWYIFSTILLYTEVETMTLCHDIMTCHYYNIRTLKHFSSLIWCLVCTWCRQSRNKNTFKNVCYMDHNTLTLSVWLISLLKWHWVYISVYTILLIKYILHSQPTWLTSLVIGVPHVRICIHAYKFLHVVCRWQHWWCQNRYITAYS